MRQYLKRFCDSIVNPKEFQQEDKAEHFQDRLLKKISDFGVKCFIKDFFYRKLATELAKRLATFLKELNASASLINFFPTKDHQWLLSAFEMLKTNTLSINQKHVLMRRLLNFRLQFCELMKSAERHGKSKEMANLFQYLILQTIEIHKEDNLSHPDPPTVVNPYDPTTGISYNFTAHGGQVRKLPKYKIEGNYKYYFAIQF
jgi:hypothetical protein